jgi:hypothetical protein
VVLAESPVTEIVPELAPGSVPDAPDGLDVTEYDVIAAPPLLTGAVKETVAVVWLVEVAVRLVGAPGVVRGVAVAVAVEPSPTVLVGLTVNVYRVPLVSPVNVQEVFEVFVQAAGGVTAGLEVTE